MKRKILLVDDEEIIRLTLGRDLGEAGYPATTAADGREALVRLKNEPFDLVITDLLMEGMGGLELLARLKESRPEVGVVILTGYGHLDSAIEALRLGADDYLLKPYRFEELRLRLEVCLAKQALKKKLRTYENILPVCAVCKKIRDDQGREPGSGDWLGMEEYLARKAGLRASHTYCPACFDAACRELSKPLTP